MVRKYKLLYISFLVLVHSCSQGSTPNTSRNDFGNVINANITNKEMSAMPTSEEGEILPIGVRALMEAYPHFIKGYKSGVVLFSDSTTLIYDDGRPKDFQTMLDESDIEDMFYICYVQPGRDEIPEYLADAGRSRNEALFKKMYGQSSSDVRKNLVNIDWFGQTIQFSSVNGAAEQLKKVAEELALHPGLAKYLKSSGSFNWRPVRGAKRMSAHSYGIAFIVVPSIRA